ncbi:MAG TPA: MFS transporter [Gammaproteobacteria bacterium]|nr:MFS transporter [Gammaproteobacteria bacterium]
MSALDSAPATLCKPSEPAWPSPAKAWYGASIFTLATALALIDRQIMNLLVEPIKQDLHISDTQMSLLVGFAFALFYAFLGIPLARLADVCCRKTILCIGIAFWSIMTACCGLAHSYWMLFLARVGVGAGESVNGPTTFSIVGDSFPPEKLAKASAVISSGFYLGSGAAWILGGAIIEAVSKMPNFVLPVIGEVHPWQTTFLIVGLPGVLVAGLVMTVHEPQRRGLLRLQEDSDKPAKLQSLPLKVILRWLLDDWKTYFAIYGGMAFKAMASAGVSAWLPSFFIRTYGWNTAQIGLAMGLILLTVAPAGLLTGGFFTEYLTKRGLHDANLRVVVISSLLAIPFAILFPLMPMPIAALTLYAIYTFFMSMAPGPQNAALVMITPNQMRAQASALYFFLYNLIGSGLGPLLVAGFTDYLFGADSALRYSLSLHLAILTPISACVIWFGLKSYGETVRRLKTMD